MASIGRRDTADIKGTLAFSHTASGDSRAPAPGSAPARTVCIGLSERKPGTFFRWMPASSGPGQNSRTAPDHLIEDALIAATAIVHHLTVVTRNIRDFAIFGSTR
jgi:hypothetical protein